LKAQEQIENLKEQILKHARAAGYDIKLIKKGIAEAERLHSSQLRKSGEPYIIHPLSVANYVANLNITEDAIIAALLHDTIEDCGVTRQDIEQMFNPTVASLVQGVTKIDEIADNSIERYTELMNLRKFIISSSSDIRVLIIKLADRLHNMRSIDALKPQKQIDYSDETLKVYVPLAEYIGIGKIKRELEDIAFRKREPVLYQKIKYKVEHEDRIHDELLEDLIRDLRELLSKNEIKIGGIFGRIKSAHAIYNKVKKQLKEGKVFDEEKLDLSKIKDFVGVSIILNSDEIECYKVLGIVHSQFEYSSKDFDDYIAKPKPNGYRAIQTTIFYKNATAEIQIKTRTMHEINEFGAASHLAYKISGERFSRADSRYSWIKNLTRWNNAKNRKVDYPDKYKIEVFADRVFVITPLGKVVDLSKGSTAIDFAYAIHSEVGNRFVGVKINGAIAKIDTKLQNGDVVEIITSKNTKKPSPEWIKAAFSTTTKQKIRKYLHIHEREDNIKKGEEIISSYVHDSLKLDWLTLDSSTLRYLYGEFGSRGIDSFYLKIFHESISKKEVLKLLVKKLNITYKEDLNEPTKEQIATVIDKKGLVIEGVEDLDYKIAGCCQPKAGDKVIGIVTLRDGLKIHKESCINLKEIEDQRKLRASWV
jgi:guanosine-3',5'-bis(diphosphate) 3'-pyrophosphohydrolase